MCCNGAAIKTHLDSDSRKKEKRGKKEKVKPTKRLYTEMFYGDLYA